MDAGSIPAASTNTPIRQRPVASTGEADYFAMTSRPPGPLHPYAAIGDLIEGSLRIMPGQRGCTQRPVASVSIEGLETNLDFLRRVVGHPAYRAGEVRIDFVERCKADLLGF